MPRTALPPRDLVLAVVVVRRLGADHQRIEAVIDLGAQVAERFLGPLEDQGDLGRTVLVAVEVDLHLLVAEVQRRPLVDDALPPVRIGLDRLELRRVEIRAVRGLDEVQHVGGKFTPDRGRWRLVRSLGRGRGLLGRGGLDRRGAGQHMDAGLLVLIDEGIRDVEFAGLDDEREGLGRALDALRRAKVDLGSLEV